MYFNSVHGNNIQLSADSSQARRVSGFCQGITFSNNPLTPLQRITFLVGSSNNNSHSAMSYNNNNKNSLTANGGSKRGAIINAANSVNTSSSLTSSKKSTSSCWNGNLRIGLTTKNPVTLTTSDLPDFSYPTLLNTDGFWITCIKSSYLKHGNKLSLVLDEKNSLQLAVNYVVKATLFNGIIPTTPNIKLWLLLDIYGATNVVQFLASDDTPYEIKQRGLDAVNNFHSACLLGGSRSIYKTRLFVLGQDESGKSSLKQALIKGKTTNGRNNNNNNNSNKKQANKKQLDLSASFRVKIDYQTNSWIVKPVMSGEYKALAAEQHRRHHHQGGGVGGGSKRLSLSQNIMSPKQHQQQLTTSNLDKKKSISDTSLLEDAIIQKRKRSTSTSYLNEEDDYDNNFCSKEDLRTFRRQLSLEDNLDKAMKREAAKGDDEGSGGGDEASEKKEENYRPRSGADSSGSSRESSDTEYDSDTNDALYAIDEYDESINMMDCDPAELKKDPTGFHYKRIAYNVYQELFTTKLFDKLWPSASSSSNTSNNNNNNSGGGGGGGSSNLLSNNFSESFFEKLALVEFETSVYNKLKSSKILYTYYERIVYNEMKLMKTKPANTIMVNPAKSNSASIDSLTSTGGVNNNAAATNTTTNENNLLSAEVKNIKSTRKKLSFTIQDLDDRTYQIFLSTRAVYLICFDLTQDLNGLAQTNFFYGFEKNGELTNLDYLDFIFKSIHFHTAIIPETASVNTTSNYETVQIEETGERVSGGVKDHVASSFERSSSISVDFKYSLLSPPVIIVGTNKNGLSHLSNKEDVIRLKFQKIREFLANKIYSNHIVEPYFAINNASSFNVQTEEKTTEESGGDQQSEETTTTECLEDFYEIEKLKRVIEAVSLNQPYMGEQLPLKWMKFEQSLEKLKNKGFFYASLSQICEIAHEKDIKTQEELTTCLNFLNDLGTIIYYGNANDIFLRNTIILRPQKLVEIFSMILDAKMPSYLSKIQSDLSDSANGSSFNGGSGGGGSSSQQHSANLKWLNAWDKFNKRGILNDSLLDVLWKSVINQKPGLLGLMKKFDFICDSTTMPVVTSGVKAIMVAATQTASETTTSSLVDREYLVPSRAKISYDEDFEEEMNRLKLNEKNAKNKKYYCDSDYEDYDSDNEVEDLADNKKKSNMFNGQMTGGSGGGENSISIVEFYYDFCGYLPETLFHRIVTRIARWTLMKTGTDTANAVRMYYRKARFYLDENHDFTIEMAPIKYARIKIQIIRLSKIVHGYLSGDLPPEPNSCAKVRNFMESTLIDLRNLWIKRLMFNACVLCSCDKICDLHQLKMCTHFKCMHFLNLDECLTNNIVTCEYRRVKTLIYKSWFPTQNISLHKGPILTATKTYSDKNMFYDEKTLPSWVKNVAKLLQVSGKESGGGGGVGGGSGKEKDKEKEPQIVTVHNENDWVALARLLGYNKSKIGYFGESENPALQLICDWIMSSDNTNLTIEFLINYLEQLKRDDVIKIINNEREKETVNSSVFLSYQWDFQEEVLKIKDNLEKAGFKCFMDVGQMGGGNMLYQKIDQAIRNAKVVIACVTPKFVVSHYCNREMALADLLRKPIVPIMLAPTPWPPPGGMGLIFSQLVYVDYFGVGGHGGVGRNADREQRNNEIVALVARHVDPSSYFLMNIDRMTDNEQSNQKHGGKQGGGKTSIFKSLMRGTSYYNGNNNNAAQTGGGGGGFIDEVHMNGANLNRRDTIRGVNNPARLSIIGGPGGGVALGANVNPNGRGGGDNSADVPRCAVCSIL